MTERESDVERLERELMGYRLRDPGPELRDRVLCATREAEVGPRLADAFDRTRARKMDGREVRSRRGGLGGLLRGLWNPEFALVTGIAALLAANVFVATSRTVTVARAAATDGQVCRELGLDEREWTCRRLATAGSSAAGEQRGEAALAHWYESEGDTR